MWTELPRPVSAGAAPMGHVRLGYARASTARHCPELDAAVKLAGEIRSSGVAVTLVVHEHKRLGRGIERAMLAEELKASDVGLELRIVITTGTRKGWHLRPAFVRLLETASSGPWAVY